MKPVVKESSGGKVSGESTGLPKQNSKGSLNDKGPSGDKRHGMAGGGGSATETGYNYGGKV